MPRLRLSGLRKRWESAERIFELEVGEITLGGGEVRALTGPNGCGKSTFLELAGLATRPDGAGAFTLETVGRSIDLNALWRDGRLDRLAELRGRYFGYVLQTGALLPFLKVRENIALAQTQAGQQQPERIDALLERLDMGLLAREYPAQLSLGQRQRVAVARALAHDPAFVLADEPTASLDPESAEIVLRLLLELARDGGSAVVIVSHDHELLDRLGLDRLPLAAAPMDLGAKGCWRTTIGARAP